MTFRHIRGCYGADKAVASALENCGKEEQGFVYDIIRQNFLVGNRGSMTEEERQANISLGMKKAEYAEKNVKNQKLDKTFAGLKAGSKAAFLESLKMFQSNNPNFLSSIINRELASKFWGL